MLRKTVLVHALSIAFGAAALSVAVVEPAMAQSNASGNVYGRVDGAAGATVVLSNTETGLRRTVTPDASGRYQASAMPPGHYKVELMREGKVVNTTEVDVLIGQGVDASFSNVAKVEITARRSRIDVSSANNGATFTAKELAQLPIQQSVSAIVQLAPNTTRADPRYAAGASFGGGGASENAYYINGFPVTNPLTQLGASELPFGAIAQAQVLTGGFGAEFGRSIGGVMNITTKSGTNNWEAGAQASIEPNGLRSKARNVYYAHNDQPTDGTLYAKNDLTSDSQNRVGAYVGGPIIEDKLFMFIAAERTNQKRDGVARTSDEADTDGSLSSGWLHRKNTTTRYLAKFDWNINDNHRLEWTSIGDKPESDLRYSDFNYNTFAHTGKVVSGGHYESVANITPTIGAKTNILRYTGNLTDALTLQVLYGENKTDHVNDRMGYNPTVPGITFDSQAAKAPGLTYNNPQPFAGQRINTDYSYDKVKSTRVDLEWKLGDHTLRAGIDDNKLSSYGAGDLTPGGFTWTYFKTDTPNDLQSLTGYKTKVNNGSGPLAAAGYYVRKQIFEDVTAAFSNQSAQYLEDRWQLTKDLLVTGGVRIEQYKNLNGERQAFLKMDNQINPRVSAVWDAYGDASLKVFGSLGRYSIQIPTHIAIRGASRSTYTRTFYTYTGVGADGQPTGLTALTPLVSPDNEFGQAKLPETVAAQNLKPSYQDEFTLGFERMYSPELNFGAKVTYRKLRTTIDDWCDQRPFDAWAAAHNVNEDNWAGFMCASINPGQTNDFLVDFSGTGKNLTPVSLSAKEMGFGKPERTYSALDLFLEHPMRNGWYGKVNYTWSRSKGNTEGQTLSAVAQTDVAATQTWDHYEIMEYANGVLPNDRTHQIKAYGYWEVTPEWILGGNFLAASGMPITCLGTYPIDKQTDGFPDYGAAYHYCFGPSGANPPSPQGSAGRLPWDVRLDASLTYRPAAVKGLSFKVDVFNVLNKQTVQQVDQLYNTDDGSRNPTWNTPGAFVGYTAPRSARFTVEYNHRF
ncbi:TonB-dependent receptor [Massilia solisilvae]|uniref:TonB-dependent receptor n=1 Tax=Massilia solisilvae TaxID=1811225 RepID=A0ABT2BIB4_9BURK|nr:TonB-dependent receptor [Massilia solisilvae]MCS0608261.1 TonB-dependent receptor [Massilia solisilvae]